MTSYMQAVTGLPGGGFWAAKIRTDTRLRLAVSCGETHYGYSADGANSGWYREGVEAEIEAWNDDVDDDIRLGGRFLGAEHWAKFNLL